MARGDLTVFEEFAGQLGQEMHDFSSDVLKIAVIDNSTPPTAADASPTWGDYSANEVSTAGGYTANGETLDGVTWTEAAGVATLDANDEAIAQNGSGFTDGYWAVIYNDTEATDAAIAFVDLGGPVSEQAGPININFNAAGILTVTVS